MAKHDVKFEIPTCSLGNNDITVKVWSDEKLLGTLTLSRGGIEWYPKNAQTPYKHDWEDFDQAIRNYKA